MSRPQIEKGVVTRYSAASNFGHLEVEITLEDPKEFTMAPHVQEVGFILLTNWEIHECVCNEFNIDKDHLVGK